LGVVFCSAVLTHGLYDLILFEDLSLIMMFLIYLLEGGNTPKVFHFLSIKSSFLKLLFHNFIL